MLVGWLATTFTGMLLGIVVGGGINPTGSAGSTPAEITRETDPNPNPDPDPGSDPDTGCGGCCGFTGTSGEHANPANNNAVAPVRLTSGIPRRRHCFIRAMIPARTRRVEHAPSAHRITPLLPVHQFNRVPTLKALQPTFAGPDGRWR